MTKAQEAIKWLQRHGFTQVGGEPRKKMQHKTWRGKMRGGGTQYLTIAEVIKYYL